MNKQLQPTTALRHVKLDFRKIFFLLSWFIGIFASAQITTYNYTGSLQTYTVPSGVYAIRIDAQGAQGGSITVSCAATGGLGARMVGDVAVTPGEVITILVGGQGQTQGEDGGGGGGSFVVRTGNVPLVVAGGGGGATNNIRICTGLRNGVNASITTSGTASSNGLIAGGTAGNGGGANVGSGCGGGGFNTDGGYSANANGRGRAYVNGGAGGTGQNNNHGGYGGGGCGWYNGGNGGGGGGYSGGGTDGNYPSTYFGGGGGGGSYNVGINQSNTAGYKTGNGLVVITELRSPCSLNFDGVNDFVSIPHAANQIGMNAITMEAWVKVGAAGTFRNIIMKGNYGYGMVVDWNNKLGYWSDASYSNCISFGSVPANVWTHVAVVVVKNTSVNFYINGVNVGSSTSSGHTTINSGSNDSMYLGFQGSGCNCNYYTGDMDEIRVWDVARTGSQILSNMNCELAAQSNLIGLYHFNDGTPNATNTAKNVLLDESSAPNSGKLRGFALSGTSSNWVAPYLPEINVLGNNVNIVDGDITAALADSTDFGIVTTGTKRRFTIENLGASPVLVSAITLTGANAADFTISGAPSSVAPSSTAKFYVTFNPSSSGIKNATINIASNDCNEATYNFDIKAEKPIDGASLNFDGINDYVLIPTLNFSGTDKMSIEAWVKPNNITTNTFYEITRQNGIGLDWLLSFQNNGTILSFGLQTSTGYTELDVPITASQFTDGNWHHVVAVYDGANRKVYKDGVLIGSDAKTGNIAYNGTINNIGAYNNVAEFFNGNIDEVRFWNKALTLSEINAYKNCEITSKAIGLVANYHFNQGVASSNNTGINTLVDSSGYGNHGTLTNFALNTATSNWVAPGSVVSGTSCTPLCGLTSNIPVAPGTYTSAEKEISGAYTCFCDASHNLLLALNLNGTGAVIPDNGVGLQIGTTKTTAWNNAGGIISNAAGGAIFNRKWDVNPSTQPTSPVKVKFFFTQTEYDSVRVRLAMMGTTIVAPNQLEMYKLLSSGFGDPHAPGATGYTLGNGSTPALKTWVYTASGANHCAEFLVNSFSGGGGGAGASGAPLPVDFINFTATKKTSNSVKLNWQIASDIQNSFFEIERSLDGTPFVKIGKINAAENNLNYQFTDNTISIGTLNAKYRIVKIQQNGNRSATEIKQVNFSNSKITATIYPNPSNGNFVILTSNENKISSISITDAIGRKVAFTQTNSGSNKIEIALPTALSNGFYYLSLVNEDGTNMVQEILVQK